MNSQERTRAMRKWDAIMRDLAHLDIELEELEALPNIPITKADRWNREDENMALRQAISHGLDELSDVEEAFPECRLWQDHKRTKRRERRKA